MRFLPITVTICSIFLAGVAESQDVSPLIKKADELDAQGRSDDAIETLKQAEKISPNNPNLLIKLSQDYSDKIDDTKENSEKLKFAKLCLEYAKKAVQQAPDNADAHVCLSIAYGKMTDFTDNKTKMEYSKIVKSEAEKAVGNFCEFFELSRRVFAAKAVNNKRETAAREQLKKLFGD